MNWKLIKINSSEFKVNIHDFNWIPVSWKELKQIEKCLAKKIIQVNSGFRKIKNIFYFLFKKMFMNQSNFLWLNKIFLDSK